MIKLQTLFVLIPSSILLALLLDFQLYFPIRILSIFWMLHLIINIISKNIRTKYVSLIYKEEALSLILLTPLFILINQNPLFYPLAVFALAEIVLVSKENILKSRSYQEINELIRHKIKHILAAIKQ